VRFKDRRDAGRQLSERLAGVRLHDPMILALPRGGVPVAFEVAQALGAPLDVFVARKIGAPGQRELGIGAIAEGGEVLANEAALHALGLTSRRFAQLAARERRELERRVQRYRGTRALPDMEDRDVVLVDDGFATGVTAIAALRSLRRSHARRLILAVPVCGPDAAQRLVGVAHEVVCLAQPAFFRAVGGAYEDFSPTSDDEVVRLLECANRTARVER
jgi:putative phosphoribosyl transferase